jgi:hypothetical protein
LEINRKIINPSLGMLEPDSNKCITNGILRIWNFILRDLMWYLTPPCIIQLDVFLSSSPCFRPASSEFHMAANYLEVEEQIEHNFYARRGVTSL